MADIVKLTIKDETCYPLSIPEAVIDPEDNKPISEVLPNIKDKKYDSTKYSGMGRKYLKKNMINGINVLEQDMISEANTIYIIQYDYDLQGQNITIPEGCILDFQGGSFSNGTIVGNNTTIDASVYHIFKNIDIQGSWIVPNIYLDWMDINDEDCRLTVQSILRLQNNDIHNVIYVPNRPLKWTPESGNRDLFILTSNTEIVIPNTITLNRNNLTHYSFIYSNWKNNISIYGGGKLIGDVGNHDYIEGSSSEWGFGISLLNGNNLSIENIECSYCIGDGIYLGGGEESAVDTYEKGITNIMIRNVVLDSNRRQGISVVAATNNLTIDKCTIVNTGKIEYAAPGAGIDFEPNYNTCTIKNVIIRDCYFNNDRSDILFYAPDVRDITIRDCYFKSNNEDTYNNLPNIVTDKGVYTGITIRNCNIEGYVGPGGESSSISIYNSQVRGIVNYDENIEYVEPTGHIEFNQCNIIPLNNFDAFKNAFYIRNSSNKYTFNDCTIDISKTGSYFSGGAKYCVLTFNNCQLRGFNAFYGNIKMHNSYIECDEIVITPNIYSNYSFICNTIMTNGSRVFWQVGNTESDIIEVDIIYNIIMSLNREIPLIRFYNKNTTANYTIIGNKPFHGLEDEQKWLEELKSNSNGRYVYESYSKLADDKLEVYKNKINARGVTTSGGMDGTYGWYIIGQIHRHVDIALYSKSDKGRIDYRIIVSPIYKNIIHIYANNELNNYGYREFKVVDGIIYVKRVDAASYDYIWREIYCSLGDQPAISYYGTEEPIGENVYETRYVYTTGTTENRPISGIPAGYMYCDTTLKKPIWWIGSKWVDATGAEV